MSSVGCLCRVDLGAKFRYDDITRNPMSSPRIHIVHTASNFFVPSGGDSFGRVVRFVVEAGNNVAQEPATVLWRESKDFVGERL